MSAVYLTVFIYIGKEKSPNTGIQSCMYFFFLFHIVAKQLQLNIREPQICIISALPSHQLGELGTCLGLSTMSGYEHQFL